MRAGSLWDAAAAVWLAWHLATVQNRTIAPRVRVRSFALVLAVTLALSAASLVGAATIRVVADIATNGLHAGQQGVDQQDETENNTPDGQNGVGGPSESNDRDG